MLNLYRCELNDDWVAEYDQWQAQHESPLVAVWMVLERELETIGKRNEFTDAEREALIAKARGDV